MKNVVIDNSAYQNALATQQNANSALNSSQQRAQQLRYNEQTYNLQQRQIDTQRTFNVINASLQAADLIVSYGSKIYDVVQQSQSSAAQNDISASLQEGQRLLQNSIASGKTYFGTNPTTGEMELIIAPEVEEWYSASREKIGNGNYMASIKDSALKSFDLSYEALKTSANSTLVEKYYSDLNTNFSTSLELAKLADIQSYVQAGGNIDAWNASSTIQGVKAINSRSDWSSEAKSAQTTSYLLEVQQEGDTQIASNLARTQGLQAALNYIESKGYYTTAEKQSMYATASKSVTQAMSAANEAAEAYMADALIKGSATPKEVYEALGNELGNVSPAIYNSAIDAAKAKQISVATTSYSNQLTTDKSNGLFDLYTTYTEMQSGSWDDLFYNISDVKTEALAAYEKAISDKETAYGKTIDESNKSLFSEYETKHKTNLSLFNEGQINGQTYVANETSYANSFYAGVQGEESVQSLWNEKVNAMATEAINAIIDNAIPERYKSEVTEAFNTIKLSMGLNLTNSKMTAEAQQTIYDMNLEFTGKVASYLQSYDTEKNGTLSVEDFKKYVTQAAQDYIQLRQSNGYTDLMEGKYKDEKYMSGKVSDFKKALSLAYNYDTGDVFVKLGTDISTGNARYMFANDTARQTFEELSTVAKTQISWLTGYGAEDMTTVCVLDDNGAPLLAPQVNVNGECYRFKDSTIQICTDGKTWIETGIKLASSSDDMTKNKNKSQVYLAMQEKKGSENLTDVQKQAQKATDTWVQTYKQPTTNQLKDHLRESADIDTAASRLKQLSDQGSVKIRSGVQSVSDYIDNLVAEVKTEKKDSGTDHPGSPVTPGDILISGSSAYSEATTSSSPATATSLDNAKSSTSTQTWVDEHKGQSVTAKQISDYLKTVNDIEAAAKELQEAYEKRELEYGAQGISFKQNLNNIVSSLLQQRRKGN